VRSLSVHLGRKKEPLYIKVKDILKERILTGQYPLHSIIPAEPQLEKEFGVSKITIRKAVELLALEGYVEKQSGVGTTVLDNKAFIKMSKGQNFSNYLAQEGKQITKDTISFSIVLKPSELEGPENELFYCIERLYYLDDEPYIHFFHYIPNALSLPEDTQVYDQSLYEVLGKAGIIFDRFRDEFAVDVPSNNVANLLGIQQQPLLKRYRYAYDINDKLIEYSVAHYNTQKQNYVVNFNV
jgi:GntR family transcriptional regulator